VHAQGYICKNNILHGNGFATAAGQSGVSSRLTAAGCELTLADVLFLGTPCQAIGFLCSVVRRHKWFARCRPWRFPMIISLQMRITALANFVRRLDQTTIRSEPTSGASQGSTINRPDIAAIPPGASDGAEEKQPDRQFTSR